MWKTGSHGVVGDHKELCSVNSCREILTVGSTNKGHTRSSQEWLCVIAVCTRAIDGRCLLSVLPSTRFDCALTVLTLEKTSPQIGVVYKRLQ